MKKSAIFLVIAAFIVACGGSSADATSNSGSSMAVSSDAPDGEKLYKTYCVTCHGLYGNMQGNGAIDLTKSVLSLEERIKVISEGRTGTVMIGFKTLLDDTKIKMLAEYMEKLRK